MAWSLYQEPTTWVVLEINEIPVQRIRHGAWHVLDDPQNYLHATNPSILPLSPVSLSSVLPHLDALHLAFVVKSLLC